MQHVLLDINQLTFNVNQKNIIQGISTKVNQGDFIVLLGANGSGKSTLLKLINRSHTPSSGSITLTGKPINQYKCRHYAKRVLSISQDTRSNLFMALTVFDNAKLYGSNADKAKSTHSAKQQLCEYLREFNPKLAVNIDQPVNKLSGGEQQILVLALCLRLKPDLLLLDEHTSALDPKTSFQIMQQTYAAAKRHQTTCIMTSHNLPLVRGIGNRLIAISEGKIIHEFNNTQTQQLATNDLIDLCYQSTAPSKINENVVKIN